MCLKRCCAASFPMRRIIWKSVPAACCGWMLGWLAGARHGFTFSLENTVTRWRRIFQAVFGNAISVPIPDGTARKFGKRCSTPVPCFPMPAPRQRKSWAFPATGLWTGASSLFFRKASPSSPAWLRRRAGTASCPAKLPSTEARRFRLQKQKGDRVHGSYSLYRGRGGRAPAVNFFGPIFLSPKTKDIDLVIANGENSADGNGITPVSAQYLFDSGVDVITAGNHTLPSEGILRHASTVVKR